MKIISLFLLLVFFQESKLLSQSTIIIPFASPIMVDGIFSEDEWQDGYSISIENKLTLYLKQSDKYVYLGIKVNSVDYKGGWADIYIAESADSIINFHSSKKLGDRKLTNGLWKKWEKWWTNKGRWQANHSFVKDTSGDDSRAEGWEFQIRKRLFHQKELKLMLDVSLMTSKFQNIIFPKHASNLTADNWLILKR